MSLSTTREYLRRAAQALIVAGWHPELSGALRRAGLNPDTPLPRSLRALPLRNAPGTLPPSLLRGLHAIGAVQIGSQEEALWALCRQEDVALESLRGQAIAVTEVDWTAHELMIAGELWRGGLSSSYLSEGHHFERLMLGRLPLITGLPIRTLNDDRDLAASVLCGELPEEKSQHHLAAARFLSRSTSDLGHPALSTETLTRILAPMGQREGNPHLNAQWRERGLHVSLSAYWSRHEQTQLTATHLEVTVDGDLSAVYSREARLISVQDSGMSVD